MPVRNPALDIGWTQESRELAGSTATRDAVMDALPDANCISFYCHGAWNPSNPAQSALLLHAAGRPPETVGPEDRGTSRGALTVQDLQQVDLHRSRLALLWACESALIGTQHLAEAIGFPAALVDAGVPAVVGSLWIVEEEATRRLAKDMLAAHISGDFTPAAALRYAQLAALQRDSDKATPTDAASLDGGRQTLARLGSGMPSRAGRSAKPPPSAPFYWAAFTMTGA
jgi:CHAT domain-containing protein